MLFKLNHSDIKLLIEALDGSKLGVKFETAEKFSEKGKYPTGRYVVDLSEGEMLLIIDSLSSCLMNSGLDGNEELNVLGRQIESLIDVFSL